MVYETNTNFMDDKIPPQVTVLVEEGGKAERNKFTVTLHPQFFQIEYFKMMILTRNFNFEMLLRLFG